MGVLKGYAKLTEAVTQHAFDTAAKKPPKNPKDMAEWELQRKNNFKYADSTVLQHFCDVYGYDYARIRSELLTLLNKWK